MVAIDIELPSGWRNPNREEITDKWRPEGSGPYLVVKEDFNGDGKVDEARILVRNNGQGIGLFVFLSDDNSIRTIQLDSLEGSRWIRIMGITTAKPGKYKTACGKGYGNVKGDEPDVIILRYPGINYFMVESANSFFHWDESTRSFQRTWISD